LRLLGVAPLRARRLLHRVVDVRVLRRRLAVAYPCADVARGGRAVARLVAAARVLLPLRLTLLRRDSRRVVLLLRWRLCGVCVSVCVLRGVVLLPRRLVLLRGHPARLISILSVLLWVWGRLVDVWLWHGRGCYWWGGRWLRGWCGLGGEWVWGLCVFGWRRCRDGWLLWVGTVRLLRRLLVAVRLRPRAVWPSVPLRENALSWGYSGEGAVLPNAMARKAGCYGLRSTT
jgi:hypothetical protein